MSRHRPAIVGFVMGVCALLLGAMRVASGEATVRIAVEGGLTSEDLRRGLEEGEGLSLRCEARNLQPDESAIWQRGGAVLDPSDNRTAVERVEVLKRGDASPTRNEDVRLTVSAVLGTDAGRYRCLVARYDPDFDQHFVQVSAEVTVSVYSFPGPPAGPRCSPGGPVALALGESVSLSCRTAKGYPTVNLSVSSPSLAGLVRPAEWPLVESGDSLTKTFRWTPAGTHPGVTFTCLVTSSHFPDANASCVIGPIRVVPRPTAVPQPSPTQKPTSGRPTTKPTAKTAAKTTAGTTTTTKVPNRSPEDPGESLVLTQDDACFKWLVAFMASAGAFVVSLCANVLLCATMLRMRHSHKSDRESRVKAAFVEAAGPGRNKLGLQLNGISNRCFTVEPLTDIGSSSPL